MTLRILHSSPHVQNIFTRVLYLLYHLHFQDVATTLWLAEGLMFIFSMCLPLVLMESAFHNLDEIQTILVDELLTYKGKSSVEHNY